MSEISFPQSVYSLFIENPSCVYTTNDLFNLLTGKRISIKNDRLPIILTRLYRKNLIDRTPTPLANGYHYSLQNKELLKRIYDVNLLPYDFEDKIELINEIRQNIFEKLNTNFSLNLDKNLAFVKKYPLYHFQSRETQQFLALLVGFIMCDGCIHKNEKGIEFYFRRESDTKLFVKDFKTIFPLENLIIKSNSRGGSYIVRILKAASMIQFICKLGAPSGNKTLQLFLIPDWIFHGPNDVKRMFLSTVIGNEGSAPSNNKWRIQFVLSKSKEKVPNLIKILNQIRAMFYHFGITTSHLQIRQQPGRQFYGRFYIKGKENLHKFYNEFRFLYASEKQEILEDLLLKNKS